MYVYMCVYIYIYSMYRTVTCVVVQTEAEGVAKELGSSEAGS